MRTTSSYSDYQPLGRIGNVQVYATTILAALYTIGMIVTTMLEAAGISTFSLHFFPAAFYGHGWLWQIFTCTFVNHPDFFFIFGIFFFYMSSIEVERYLGRSRYLVLYLLTLAVPAFVLGVWYLFNVQPDFYTMYEVMVALFIAFATLYPNIEIFGWVPLKYVAFACIFISALQFLSEHDWPGMSVLLAECALGFGFVRYLQRGGIMEFGDFFRKLNPFRRRPQFRVLPSPSRNPDDDIPSPTASVDAILDKIAQSGFASLTPDERDQLENARKTILKKDPSRG